MSRGAYLNARKPPLTVWKLATRPKKEGWLGILNLETQNDALLLKNHHKFFNRTNCPWVQLIQDNHYGNGSLLDQRHKCSFWWKIVLKLLNKLNGIAMLNLTNGSTILLWHDMWNNIVRNMQSAIELDNLQHIF
jgi:hypothetical protein